MSAGSVAPAYIDSMNALKIRSVAAVAIAATILIASTGCTATSDVDKVTACLDDLGVDYSVEDNGAVVIATQYADEGSEESRALTQECMDSGRDDD